MKPLFACLTNLKNSFYFYSDGKLGQQGASVLSYPPPHNKNEKQTAEMKTVGL